jgi:hypothetical protein
VATTDTAAAWLVQVGRWSGKSPNTGTDYRDEATLFLVATGEPSFEVAGAAADLDAWLWNRPTQGPINRVGDTSAFDAVIRTGVT